jgi:hypothetical protein
MLICNFGFQAWVVERFGKFNRILEPGLNFLIPIVDNIKYVQSLKEIAIDIPSQSAITSGSSCHYIDSKRNKKRPINFR